MIARLLVVLVVVFVASACALTTRRGRLIRMPRCADGLPPLVLIDVACPPNGLCGYTCAPNRWQEATP
jgi:hypothetical protein